MTIDEQIAREKDLIAQREQIDRQLAELFAGAPITKKTPRCKLCGEVGHNAKGCPTKRATKPSYPSESD